MVVGAQALGDAVGPVLGAREDEHAVIIRGGEQSEEQAEFPAVVGDIDAVLHRVGHRAGRADLDALRIAQGPAGQIRDFRRQGGGEKEGLTVLRALGDDALHRREETDVEHAIDLVEDEDFDVVEFERALLEMVLEPSRRGDDDIESGAQGLALRAVADAAEDRADFEVGEAGEVAHGSFHLHGQLARRFEHEAAEFSVVSEFLQRGQGERGGFSRPGLGGGNDIPAREGRRDRPELDRGRFPVAHGLDAFEKWLGQSKLGERHESRAPSGRGRALSMRVSRRGYGGLAPCRLPRFVRNRKLGIQR